MLCCQLPKIDIADDEEQFQQALVPVMHLVILCLTEEYLFVACVASFWYTGSALQ